MPSLQARELSASQVNLIQSTWNVVANSAGASEVVQRNLSLLAPNVGRLLKGEDAKSGESSPAPTGAPNGRLNFAFQAEPVTAAAVMEAMRLASAKAAEANAAAVAAAEAQRRAAEAAAAAVEAAKAAAEMVAAHEKTVSNVTTASAGAAPQYGLPQVEGAANQKQSAEALIDHASSIIAELDAVDMGEFVHTIEALRTSAVVQSIEPENFPSIQRAFLFSIWELADRSGVKYSDEVAKAFSQMLDIIFGTLRPELTAAEKQKMAYFHRRAPGNVIGIESPQALRHAQLKDDGQSDFSLSILSALGLQSPGRSGM